MRILLDQGVYDFRNKGNVALLQAAVNRFHQLWPTASLEVITVAPHVLRIYCPKASPVGENGRYEVSGQHRQMDSLLRQVRTPALRLLFDAREELWARKSSLALRLASALSTRDDANGHRPQTSTGKDADTSADPPDDEQASRRAIHRESVLGADLVVATGGGIMCDIAKNHALPVLDRLEAAVEHGIPTAMVGQGIGPITDLELLARVKAVLPRVDFIAVRESRAGLPLLESIGVDPARVMTTGDDAIEMAYRERVTTWGNGIGVSMRVAHYTGVESHHIEVVRTALQRVARRYAAPMIALPISRDLREVDAGVIGQLLSGYRDVSPGGWRRFEDPRDIIHNTARCRVVVTGTYHAAVFALAQGIPVVGLVRFSTYTDKFKGLAEMFGTGCDVIGLDEEHLETKLVSAVEHAWDSAERIRPELLVAAARQIELGHAAYHRVYELFESHLDRAGVDAANQ